MCTYIVRTPIDYAMKTLYSYEKEITLIEIKKRSAGQQHERAYIYA